MYNATRRSKIGILFNNSPSPIQFVSVHQNGILGSELGSFRKISDLIQILPSEGTIAPYSHQKVKITINPKKTIKLIEKLVAFVRFSIVSRKRILRVPRTLRLVKGINYLRFMYFEHLLEVRLTVDCLKQR